MTSLPDNNADGRFGLHRASDIIHIESDLITADDHPHPPAAPVASNVVPAQSAPSTAAVQIQSSPAVNEAPKQPTDSEKNATKTKVNFWNKIAGSTDKKEKKEKKDKKSDKAKKEKKHKKDIKTDKKSTKKASSAVTSPAPAPAPAAVPSSSKLRQPSEELEPQSPQETFPGIPLHVMRQPGIPAKGSHLDDPSERSQGSKQKAPAAATATPARNQSVLSRAFSIFSPNKKEKTTVGTQTPAPAAVPATPAPAPPSAVAATPAHVPSRAPPARTPSLFSSSQMAHPPPPPPVEKPAAVPAPAPTPSQPQPETRVATTGTAYRDSPTRQQQRLAAQQKLLSEDSRDSASPALQSDVGHSAAASAENSAPTALALAAALDKSISAAEVSGERETPIGLQKMALDLNSDALSNSKQAVQRTSARRLWDMKSEMSKADGIAEMQRFLIAKDMQSLVPLLLPKEITYQQLLQMNEESLKNLQVPMLQRRRLLFEIVEENNRNFLKQDTSSGAKTPHRTPRSSRQSRDFIRQDVIAPAGTAYVTPSTGHVSPRFRSTSKTHTLADYEEQIAELNKRKDEWKQRYMAQERRNRELEQYMHSHFEAFRQFISQQEADYNRLLTRLRDEGLPSSGASTTALPNQMSAATSTSASGPVVSSSAPSGPAPSALTSSNAPLPAVEPAKEPVLEEGNVSNEDKKDPNRNSVQYNHKPLTTNGSSAQLISSSNASVSNSGPGSGFGSLTNASRAIANDPRPPQLTNSQMGRPLPTTSSNPTVTNAATPVAAAAAPPTANGDTAPRSRSTQNRNSLKRGSNSRAAFARIPTGAQGLQHLERVRAKCLFEYRAENQKELSFHAGDIVTILNQDQSGWWLAHHNGRSGFVPRNYLEVI